VQILGEVAEVDVCIDGVGQSAQRSLPVDEVHDVPGVTPNSDAIGFLRRHLPMMPVDPASLAEAKAQRETLRAADERVTDGCGPAVVARMVPCNRCPMGSEEPASSPNEKLSDEIRLAPLRAVASVELYDTAHPAPSEIPTPPLGCWPRRLSPTPEGATRGPSGTWPWWPPSA
jgi:hypothetical protein